MWLINFLPYWVFHLVLIGGLLALGASYALSMVPLIAQYKVPVRAAGAILIVVGLFLEGAISNNEAWQMKVLEAEKRAQEAEVKAAKENVKIVTKTVEKIKVVTDVQVVVQKEIVEKAVMIDSQCVVSPAAIEILNKSVNARQGEAK